MVPFPLESWLEESFMLLFYTKGQYNISCHSWEPRPVTSVHSHTAKHQFMANLIILILDIWRFSFIKILAVYLKILILTTCICRLIFNMKLYWCSSYFMLLKLNFHFKIYFLYLLICTSISSRRLWVPYWFKLSLFVCLAIATNITSSNFLLVWRTCNKKYSVFHICNQKLIGSNQHLSPKSFV